MSTPDALTQHITGLEKPILTQIASQASALARENTTLQTENVTKTAQYNELQNWVRNNVPVHVKRGWCLGITVGTGTAVGVAYGLLPWPYSLVGSVAVAAVSGTIAAMTYKDKPDMCNAALAVTSGAAAGAAAMEAAKNTGLLMQKRAEKKAAAKAATTTAVAPPAPTPTPSKKGA